SGAGPARARRAARASAAPGGRSGRRFRRRRASPCRGSSARASGRASATPRAARSRGRCSAPSARRPRGTRAGRRTVAAPPSRTPRGVCRRRARPRAPAGPSRRAPIGRGTPCGRRSSVRKWGRRGMHRRALLLGVVSPLLVAAPAAAQAWNSGGAVALAQRAIARRSRAAADSALRDYKAQAHGFLFFLGQFGEGLADPPRLIKADQLELEVYWKAPASSKQRIVGTLYLDAETADLVRLAFNFTPRAYLDPQLEDISIVLDNALWETRFWLPYRQEIEIRRRATWLDVPARGIIRGRWEIDGYVF